MKAGITSKLENVGLIINKLPRKAVITIIACFHDNVSPKINLILLWKNQIGFSIKKGNMKYFILRSLFGTIGILCNFYAIDHLVLADASMLNKMSPFFVLLFSWLK